MDDLFGSSVGVLCVGVSPPITMTRGSVIGGRDKIPDPGSPIMSVVQVYSAVTEYQENVDYTVSGNYIQWGTGSEPPTGGTYYVSVTTVKKTNGG